MIHGHATSYPNFLIVDTKGHCFEIPFPMACVSARIDHFLCALITFSLEGATEVKFAPLEVPFLVALFFAGVKILRLWPKTMVSIKFPSKLITPHWKVLYTELNFVPSCSS